MSTGRFNLAVGVITGFCNEGEYKLESPDRCELCAAGYVCPEGRTDANKALCRVEETSRSNDSALMNMLDMFLTIAVLNSSLWLKDIAPWNIELIEVTLDVSTRTGLLKEAAPLIILDMSKTFAVVKSTIWLKDAAPWNMELIDITLDVSKSTVWLKDFAPENIDIVFLTLFVEKFTSWLKRWSLGTCCS